MSGTFSCPECRAGLKSKIEVVQGTSVKCPRCESIVVVPETGSSGPTGQTAAAAPHIPLLLGASQQTERLREGRPSLFPVAPRAHTPLDHETADYLPLRKGSLSSLRRHKRIVLILGFISGSCALMAVVLSLFGFPSQQEESIPQVVADNIDLARGTGQEDLLSFVPQEFKVFVGANLSMIPQQPKWQVPWQMGIAGGLRRMPAALARLPELIAEIDRVLIAVNFEQQLEAAQVTPEMLVVLRTKAPYTRQRLRELLGIENRSLFQVKGRSFYLVHAEDQVAIAMHLVNDRIVVLAVTREQRLADVLSLPDAVPVGDDLARTEVRAVENNLVWTAGAATPTIRGWLARLDARILVLMAPELVPALGPLQNVKGGAAALELTPNGTWSLRVRAFCSAAADAQQLQAACQEFWDKKARMYLNLARMMLPGDAQAAAAPLLDQLANNFKASAQGSEVELRLEVSADALLQAMGQPNGPQAMPGPDLPHPPLLPQFLIPQRPPLVAPGR